MAMNVKTPFLIFIFMALISSVFVSYSSCLSPELLVKHHGNKGFLPAVGTWYGDRHGAGSTGGACGFGDNVWTPPFSSMIAAGNSRIYLHGKGCGHCYEIKCSRRPYCSGNPIRVTITDECPGCNNLPFHFDLSGTAFGAMASPGQADNLLNLGQVDIQYQRVLCNYGRTKIAFKIDAGTNPGWFAAAIEFVDRLGELRYVAIGHANSKNFVQMQNIWGVVWAANINSSFRGPFSFWLTSPRNQSILAQDVVPSDFVPGKTYYSNVNF